MIGIEVARPNQASPRVGYAERLALALDATGVQLSAQACAHLVDLLGAVWPDGQLPPATGEGAGLPDDWVAASRGTDRSSLLRAAGEAALLRAGLFRDALIGQDGAVENNGQVGRLAFVELSARLPMDAWQRARLYAELASRFDEVADVLLELGDAARSESTDGLVSLTTRYLREERPEDRMRLVRRGLMVPVAALPVQ